MWDLIWKNRRKYTFNSKLDGVGPVDNRPSTDKLHHFVRKRKKKLWHVTCDTWHVTRDMWHVTRDTWHVTHDMWHVTPDTFGGVNILSKFQLPSSYRLWFMILWRSGGKGSLSELINQSMSNEAVYRTAPATPGLLTRRGRPRWHQTLHRLAPKKRRRTKMWHMTPDTWHVTPDTWHLTCDTWWGVNILSKCQLSSSQGLGVMMLWRFGGKCWLSNLIGNRGVCKTAPATSGLLISLAAIILSIEFH